MCNLPQRPLRARSAGARLSLFGTVLGTVLGWTAVPASAQCESQKLVASDAASLDLFGTAVALSGGTILVGASEADGAAPGAGAVYVYSQAGGAWAEQQRLFGAQPLSGYGISVALDGETAVVGGRIHPGAADCDYRGNGVEVYRRTASGWTRTQTLRPPAVTGAPVIGDSVAISGDTIVVGAAEEPCLPHDTFYREAFVYERTTSGWIRSARLLPEPAPLDTPTQFGIDVAIDGDRIAVAAPGYAYSFAEPCAYVFERGSGDWSRRTRLADAALGGSKVALSGGTVVVTGYAFQLHAMQTFVFVEDGTGWPLQQVLPAAEGAAIEGDTLALSVGAPNNAWNSQIRLFERTAGQWYGRAPFAASDVDLQDSEHLGVSLALDAARVLAGSPHGDAALLAETGAAYVFEREVAQPYCVTSVNTSGEAARLQAEACPSVAAQTLTLHALGVPSTLGLFAQGTRSAQVVFGAGTRCVGGNVFRSPVRRASGNQLSWQVDYTPANPGALITPGSTWYFQCWFRDGQDLLNTSDGLEITFRP